MAAKNKSRGLGRGLDALFADQEPVTIEKPEEEKKTEAGDSVSYIDINNIKPNKNQPRKVFDPEKISELSASIKEHGIIQPLIVRPSGKNYEIVAGERRWRAAREADIKTVPCIIREFSDEENMLVAIIENMQREDLNPVEEAEGISQMIETYGLTQEEVSKNISKSRPYITNSLRLLGLPKEVRDYLSDGSITAGHARAILSAGSEKKQLELCREVIDKGLSVRQTEQLASAKHGKKAKKAVKSKSLELLAVEQELKELYGTKVKIEPKRKGGKIELEYYSKEELNRLIDILRTAEIS